MNWTNELKFSKRLLLIGVVVGVLLVTESVGEKDGVRTLGSKKQKVVLNELTDVKDWKKLIKTKTNVLICFGNGRTSFSSDDILNTLKEAAELIRGLGTIATVDCSSGTDAKKLCKKVKVSPNPGEYILRHFNNGDFNKDYDRAPKVSSVVNFMKDPTGDLPWDEDETAQDVVHLPDLPTLLKLVKKESGSKGILVMFYAPWCGFCKRIKPDYVAAAKELKGEAIIAAIDVNKPENGGVRQKYNITGFPTILYFRNGQMKQQYEGENNKDGIVNFMRNPTAPPVEKPKEAEWSDEPSEVVHIKTDNFDAFIKEHSSVFVTFYAPWCGHCRKIKPELVSAAAKMKSLKLDGVIAAVDATKENSLASRFDVKGYPTVKYFKDGELAFDVGNARDEATIIDFMKDPKEPPPPPPPEKAWSEEESSVIHLNEDNFKSILRKKKLALVMFYAPWCGHCRNAKPDFMAAASEKSDDPKIMYGAVDCTVEKSVCETYEVKGFPTFKIFQYFNKEDVQIYDGERNKAGFLNFMQPSEKSAEKVPAEDDWSEHPGHENVHMLTDSNIEPVLASRDSVLIIFYAPWCTHCVRTKKDYAAAAKEVELGGFGILAAVDCTRFQSVCQKYKVSGYPTIQYFKNGKFSQDYNESRAAADFVKFMKNMKKGKVEL